MKTLGLVSSSSFLHYEDNSALINIAITTIPEVMADIPHKIIHIKSTMAFGRKVKLDKVLLLSQRSLLCNQVSKKICMDLVLLKAG